MGVYFVLDTGWGDDENGVGILVVQTHHPPCPGKRALTGGPLVAARRSLFRAQCKQPRKFCQAKTDKISTKACCPVFNLSIPSGDVPNGHNCADRWELREELAHPPASANGTPAPSRDPASLPVVTYGLGGPVKFHMNGEIVDLIPVRAAHIGGDTMIRFENANAIMIAISTGIMAIPTSTPTMAAR
jgi:hypothetical protein